MTTDLQTLALLERIEARVVAAQLLAAGTSAWAPLRRLAVDLRSEITAGQRELDVMAEYLQARELDYWFEERPTPEVVR
jgi:hypothetical protein